MKQLFLLLLTILFMTGCSKSDNDSVAPSGNKNRNISFSYYKLMPGITPTIEGLATQPTFENNTSSTVPTKVNDTLRIFFNGDGTGNCDVVPNVKTSSGGVVEPVVLENYTFPDGIAHRKTIVVR